MRERLAAQAHSTLSRDEYLDQKFPDDEYEPF